MADDDKVAAVAAAAVADGTDAADDDVGCWLQIFIIII